jgi:phage/plasmid-like protein (TIGR03299 family)
MSHQLEIRNGEASVFVVGEPAWHKLGKVLPERLNAAEAIAAARLDFTVSKVPIYVQPVHGLDLMKVKGHYATRRDDTGAVLGSGFSEQYTVLQNAEAFGFFDALVDQREAIYETAGVLGNGERIWIMAKLPDYVSVGKGDDVGKYVLLSNSHDGSGAVKAKFTAVRVVCANTLAMALRDHGTEVSVKHTRNVKANIDEAHRVLQLANKAFMQVEEIWRRMSLRTVSSKEVLDYCKALVPDNPELAENPKASNARAENARALLTEAVGSGMGQNLITARGTLWGLYNGAVEYADFERTSRGGASARLESMWYGSGAKFKDKAWSMALDLMN